MAAQKQYVGKGWKRDFPNGGSVINISLKKDQLLALEPDKYGEIRLVVGERREPDAKSKATHAVYVDDYRKGTSPAEF